jgi:hypothetical protein
MAEVATKQKHLHVTVDLVVNEDNWNEAVAQGCTDSLLVSEVRQSFYVPSGRLWDDGEVQNVEVIEVQG